MRRRAFASKVRSGHICEGNSFTFITFFVWFLFLFSCLCLKSPQAALFQRTNKNPDSVAGDLSLSSSQRC